LGGDIDGEVFRIPPPAPRGPAIPAKRGSCATRPSKSE